MMMRRVKCTRASSTRRHFLGFRLTFLSSLTFSYFLYTVVVSIMMRRIKEAERIFRLKSGIWTNGLVNLDKNLG